MVKWVNNGQMGKYIKSVKQQCKQGKNDNTIFGCEFSNNYKY